MRQRARLALGLLMLIGSAGLPAQSREARQVIAAWRDSLATRRDTTWLLQHEQALLRQVQASAPDPMRHLRLGFLALHRGALGDARQLDNAAAEFQVAVDLAPAWPVAWLGLGTAELRVAEREAEHPGGERRRQGDDARRRAAAALVRAVREDTTVLPEVLALAADWQGRGVVARAVVLQQVTRGMADLPLARDHRVVAVRATVERALGEVDSAAVLLGTLVREDSSPARLLQLAMVRFEARRSDGLAPWYEGLRRADPITLRWYRTHLTPLLSPRELSHFDQLAPEARRDWVAQQFHRRDALGLLPAGQRLQIHYQRLRLAQGVFTAPDSLVPYLLRDTVSVLNDPRALLYLRQGEPGVRVDVPIPGLPPTESWRYGPPEAGHVFHFVARETDRRWALAPSVRDLLPNRSAATLDTGALRLSRERLGGQFDTLPPLPWDRLVSRDRRDVTAARAWDTGGDRVALALPGTLPGHLTVVGLGGMLGAAEAQILYAVPAGALRAVRVGVRPGYDVRIRAAFFTADSTILATLDTVTFVTPTDLLQPDDTLYGRVPVRVPAGAVFGRAVLFSEEAGLEMPRGVAAHPGGGAADRGVADLAFGLPGEHLFWVLPTGDTTWVAPTATLPTGEPVVLTTQLFGYAPGTTVRVETTVRQPRGGFVVLRAVRRLLGQGDRVLQRAVVEAPVQTSGQWLVQSLQTTTLAPGAYTVQVRATSSTGRTSTRESVLRLEE